MNKLIAALLAGILACLIYISIVATIQVKLLSDVRGKLNSFETVIKDDMQAIGQNLSNQVACQLGDKDFCKLFED